MQQHFRVGLKPVSYTVVEILILFEFAGDGIPVLQKTDLIA